MTNHQKCHHIFEHLSDFIDGDLENQQLCQEIESHLQDCDNCQIVVDTLKKTIYLYHTSTQTTSLSKEAKHRLYQKLDLEEFFD